MLNDPNQLIATLVADLRPVRAMKARDGLLLATGSATITVVLTVLLLGLRADVANAQFGALFLFANGLFLIVGLVSAMAAVGMALPRVGQSSQGWKWAAAMGGLLPTVAVIMLVSGTEPMPAALVSSHELKCVAMGLGLGLLTAVALVWWLRRGAPTSSARAGLLVGISSGSIGMLAFALHCPFDSFYHVGFGHALPVVIGAVIGRLVVPKLVRW
ncbi:MAG: DUF1109 domain-containing protein [Sphingomicrobium sp.]